MKDINIGIFCWYGSNVYLLRQQLASLFVNINPELINEFKRTKPEFYYEELTKNIKEEFKKVKYNNYLCAVFVQNWYNQKNQFETIQEYIDGLIEFGFTPIDTNFNNNIVITLVVDGLFMHKTPDFNYFYNYMNYNQYKKIVQYISQNPNITSKIHSNNIIDSSLIKQQSKICEYDDILINDNFKEIAENYYYNEFDNNTNLADIYNTYLELTEICKKYNIKVNIEGTKYNTNVSINRMIWFSRNKDKYLKLLDDDDFSCGVDKIDTLVTQLDKSINKDQIYIYNSFDLIHSEAIHNAGFWNLIITPTEKEYKVKTKYINCEDVKFCEKYKPIGVMNNIPIYYRFMASKNCNYPNNEIMKIVDEKYINNSDIDTSKYPGFEPDYIHEYVWL